jgi:hypothetical protein
MKINTVVFWLWHRVVWYMVTDLSFEGIHNFHLQVRIVPLNRW